MKEFEKQWKCGMLSGSPSSFNSGASAKEAAQFNWRAALEWVLKNVCFNEERVTQTSHEIRTIIGKELEL